MKTFITTKEGVAVVFAAQAFNISLSASDYITVIATATLASIVAKQNDAVNVDVFNSDN